MATVYIVSTGEYSDWEVRAVFTNKEKAEQFQQFADPNNSVEEWELDREDLPQWYKDGKKSYYCRFGPETGATTCSEARQDSQGGPPFDKVFGDAKYGFGLRLVAESEEKAVKVASERFIRHIYDASEQSRG
jgi:hypothetical protein